MHDMDLRVVLPACLHCGRDREVIAEIRLWESWVQMAHRVPLLPEDGSMPTLYNLLWEWKTHKVTVAGLREAAHQGAAYIRAHPELQEFGTGDICHKSAQWVDFADALQWLREELDQHKEVWPHAFIETEPVNEG